MVTGTLEGKPVPWFDQMMAWRFNQDGKITKTVFWSDTFYWHYLYEKNSGTSQSTTLTATNKSFWVVGSTLLQPFLGFWLFVSGVWVGRRFEARQDDKGMHYLQVS